MAEEETIKEASDVSESVNAESSANTAEDELIQEQAAEPSPENESEVRIKAAEDKCNEYYERLLRVSAEFENYKKRSAREADSFRKFANESILKDFLTVVDNLERAIQSSANIGEDGKSCISGSVFREATRRSIRRIS